MPIPHANIMSIYSLSSLLLELKLDRMTERKLTGSSSNVVSLTHSVSVLFLSLSLSVYLCLSLSLFLSLSVYLSVCLSLSLSLSSEI